MPKADRSRFIVEEFENEVVVFDQSTNEAHCLDATAAFVWSQCNGSRSTDELCKILERKIGQSVLENELSDLLEMMESKGLIDWDQPVEEIVENVVTRRGVLGRAVTIGTLCVTIQSIVAPTPAHAASCGGSHQQGP